MEKFVVSARKYRPQNFETVVGQQHITTTLKNAIVNNQLAHAFLFCGPRGVGKTTCARILAKTINCQNRSAEGEACNECTSCTSFDNGTSLNIHELDAASNNSVDDIRTLVDQVRFAPQAGDYKVYIVDEVHMLSAAAFNAFLKTLEEPPPYAIFILATTEKHKILPTILSRCQIFDFKRITNNDTVEHLKGICKKEGIKAEQTALHLIAQKSEGCLRDSLSIMDKIASFTDGKITYENTIEHLNILDEDYYFQLLDFMLNQKLSDALLLFDTINSKGFEGDIFIDGFIEFMRNLLVSRDEKAVALLEVADDFKKKYIEKAKEISPNWIIASLNILTEAAMGFKQSRNKRLYIELLLIKLSYLQQAVELSGNDMLLKKKILTDAKPVAFRRLNIISAAETEPPSKPVAKPIQEEAIYIQKEKVEKAVPVVQETEATSVKPSVPSLGGLDKVRQRVKEKQHISNNEPKPLTHEDLLTAWNIYVDRLREKKQPSTVAAMNDAVIEVINDNEFSITTNNAIQQKFVEAERTHLISHVQQYFNNRLIKFNLLLVLPEKSEEDEPVQTLSARQQYEQMIADNPMIKKLKDKLKLELG